MTRLHAFNREQLLASARGELFGTAAGRLPNDPMLMFDRITDIREDGGPHGKGMVRAELDIRPDLWFFGCHFIGDPVMPERPSRSAAETVSRSLPRQDVMPMPVMTTRRIRSSRFQ